AYNALYKATWNYEWRSSAFYQIATIDCIRHDWETALEHLDGSLATNRDHNKAITLRALVLHRTGRSRDAISSLEAHLTTDPLDHWAAVAIDLIRSGAITIPASSRNDAQTILDLAFDFAEAGWIQEAIDLLETHQSSEVSQVAVPNPLERTAMTAYAIAWLKSRVGATDARASLESARSSPADHFFPSRLDEMDLLEWALAQPGDDSLAAYGLGNLLFDKRRHADAIACWDRAAASGTNIPQVHRNLGIAIWNHHGDGERAAACYTKARELDPADARLVSESDQLARKRNMPLEERLEFLETHRDLALQRDESTVEIASLLNLTGRPEEALDLILSRRFHPWEGGEGAVLRQYTSARLLIGERALDRGDAEEALKQFSLAMDTPDSLGEAYHPLQAKADVNHWIGRSLKALGRTKEAEAAFTASAAESGDFTSMAVAEHSPLSYFRGLSLRELGRENEAQAVFRAMLDYASASKQQPAKIDYFATSLPNLLVFDEDLKAHRDAGADLIAALAYHSLGNIDKAEAAVRRTLAFDRSQP
ncbi:MAG: tetratricopeptide repeat protein, partial [Verrucomicrobiae bacterium]|nr:tetratricopeptide repeat protein [Verrucomicrobiae bacterium]